MAEPKWLSLARLDLGIKEIVGERDNPKVVEYFKLSGHPEIKDDETAWCAAFVGAMLAKAGVNGTGSLWALSYADWGMKLKYPALGAIASKKRNGGGHVFFIVGWDDQYVWGLGGNQNNQVSINRYPRSVIHSMNWPKGVPLPIEFQPRSLKLASAYSSPASEA